MRLRQLLPALLLLSTTVALPGCNRQQVLTANPAMPADPEFIELDAAVAEHYIEANSTSEVTARLRLHIDGDLNIPRPPANVALVMDTSGSMAGEAIEKARTAAATLLDSLQNGDTISVVAFGSKPEVIAPATLVSDTSRERIKRDIAQIVEGGTTNMAGGLASALAELKKSRVADGDQLNRIVLLSDGVPNDAASVGAQARDAASYRTPITALGLGLDFHETLLAELARTTGGRYVFVEEPTELASMFRDEMLDLDRLVAQNVFLQLSPGPDVVITDVVGLAVSDSGRNKVVSLGNLLEGQAHDVIVKMQTADHAAGATVELADVSLSFTYAGQSFTRDAFLSTVATDDSSEIATGLDTSILLVAARAQTAAATLQIIETARSGLLDLAQQQLQVARTDASAAMEIHDDQELSRLADDLDALEDSLPELAPAQGPTAANVSPTPLGLQGDEETPQTEYFASEADSPAPVAVESAESRKDRGRKRERRAKHNRRAHSRAYNALAPRSSE